MNEIIAKALEYVLGVWRYKRSALIIAWLVCLGGWVYVAQIPEKFQATARLQIDNNSVLRPLLRGLAIQPDLNRRVELMSRTLLSRPNLEKLMQISDLDLKATTPEQAERIMDTIRDGVALAGDSRNSSLYALSYVHPDRDEAKRVLQSLITVFVENILGDERQDSSDAGEFIDDQIKEYEQRMIAAESRLAEFKKDHVGFMPGQTGDYYRNLEVLTEQLESSRLSLKEVTNRRKTLQRQLEGEEPSYILSEGDQFEQSIPADARIAFLQKKLDELLLRYTELYPEVVRIKRQIEDLEQEKLKEDSGEIQISPENQLRQSPTYQNMRTMLVEAEARESELQARVTEYSRALQKARDDVNRVPEIEAELKQLNRDYDAIAQQHADLLKRREAAHLSGEIERKSDTIKLKVVDPVFVPSEPSYPNKLALNAVVVVVGIVAGIGAALLQYLLQPTFMSRITLSEVTGVPILGTVKLALSDQQAAVERKRLLQFYLGTLLLILAAISLNVLQGFL